MKQCKECGQDFAPKNPKGVFCSKICKQKDYRKKIAIKIRFLKAHGLGTPNPPIGKSIELANLKPVNSQQVSTLGEQLRAVEAEKLPDYIKTEQGRIFWQQGQRKKINELKQKLKP